MNKYDYRAILRFKHSGDIAENQTVTSNVVTIGNDEALQIHKIEITPPMNSGNMENMFVRLVIDGNQYPFVYLHSSATKTILGDHKSTNPLLNTCPKARKSVAIEVIGGPGGVTGDFEIRVWGDYFKGDDALRTFFGATVFNNTPAVVNDNFRGKTISVLHPVPISIANFASFPGGGPSADKPNVFPIAIYNFNNQDTTPNMEYVLSNTNVSNMQFPMFWNLDTTEAVVIDRIGALIDSNGKYVGIKVGNDYYPVGNFEVDSVYNDIPLNADTTTVPSLTELTRKVIITNELGGLFVQDDGTAISAEGALVAVLGKYIYLK